MQPQQDSRSPLGREIDLAIAGTWPIVMFIGLMTIGIGVILMAWPSETLKVLSVLLGIQLLLFGLFRLISAFSSQTLAPGLTGFVGVISMIAGVIVIRNPFETVAVLAAVLGVVWIVGGSIELISSIADRSLPDRGWLAFSGILSVVAGIIVVSWPAPTVAVMAWVSGIYLAVMGVMFVIGAFRLKSAEG